MKLQPPKLCTKQGPVKSNKKFKEANEEKTKDEDKYVTSELLK